VAVAAAGSVGTRLLLLRQEVWLINSCETQLQEMREKQSLRRVAQAAAVVAVAVAVARQLGHPPLPSRGLQALALQQRLREVEAAEGEPAGEAALQAQPRVLLQSDAPSRLPLKQLLSRVAAVALQLG
jgi:hypothetical protein